MEKECEENSRLSLMMAASSLSGTLCSDWIAVISSDSAAVIGRSVLSHGETCDGGEQRGEKGVLMITGLLHLIDAHFHPASRHFLRDYVP